MIFNKRQLGQLGISCSSRNGSSNLSVHPSVERHRSYYPQIFTDFHRFHRMYEGRCDFADALKQRRFPILPCRQNGVLPTWQKQEIVGSLEPL